jgi:crossover junction endodeoxyribonuclease RuvC
MTPTKPNRILAIDPGTREMGVALLEGNTLVYHGVKVIRKGKTPSDTLKRAIAVVERLFDDFQPTVLVVEKAFFARNRNVALLNVLVDEIQARARSRKLRVLAFATSTVRKQLCGNGWATKEDVAKLVAHRFPELKAYLGQNRKWKDRFHANMFDAVALGVMAINLRRAHRDPDMHTTSVRSSPTTSIRNTFTPQAATVRVGSATSNPGMRCLCGPSASGQPLH